MKIETKDFGSFQIRAAELLRKFPGHAVRELEKLLARWTTAFSFEPTWSQRQFGIPSILARIDCSFKWDDKKLLIYEVEERPAALGVSITLSPDTNPAVKEWASWYPRLGAVISPLRRLEDDSLVLPIYTCEEALSSGAPVIVRAEPAETEFHCLQQQSASSLVQKGNRKYGVELGLWNEAPSQLPWDKAWALKATGSKAKAIVLWHPDSGLRRNQAGFSSRNQIEKFRTKHKDVYLQELYEPEVLEIDATDYYLMYRIHFGWNPEARRYQLLTGSWWARPERIVHGASNTVLGGVSFD